MTLLSTAALYIAAVAVLVWEAVQRLAGGRRTYELLLHRLLHRDPDGAWTWRVRGKTVPARCATDVCMKIEPDADVSYCPDCLLGVVQWDAPARAPQALECRDCGSLFSLALIDRSSKRRLSC